MTDTTDIDPAAFLESQLRSDEIYANAARGLLGIDRPWYSWTKLKEVLPGMSRADCQHIERQSPAAVFARVAAQRLVLADYTATVKIRDEAAARIEAARPNALASDFVDWNQASREAMILECVVRQLASAYVPHGEPTGDDD